MGIRLSVQSKHVEPGATPSRYEFDQERIVLGREAGADVQLPDAEVSVKHATLQVRGAGYVVVDENSTNGTRLGNERLAPGRPKLLRSGEVLTIGPFRLSVEAGVAVASPTSADRTAALARDLLRRALGGEETKAARVVVLNGPLEGHTVLIPEAPGRIVVGRGEECTLSLEDADASREHVELTADLDGVMARDLGSKNGFSVNGRALLVRRLSHGDELMVGRTLIIYEDPATPAVAEVAALEDVVAAPEVEAEELEAKEPSEETRDRETEQAPAPEIPTEKTPQALAPAPAPAAKARRASADWIIYALAAAVLGASILSLLWLFNAN